MQVEQLSTSQESYNPMRIGTVLQWGDEYTLVEHEGRVRSWNTGLLKVRPIIDKASPLETNRVLSAIADTLDVIAEQLQEISGRIG